jgi:hypothetical protein
MKKLLLLFSLLAIISCSKSDNGTENSSSSNLIGKWKLISRNGVAISSCEAQYPFLILNSNNIGTEGEARLMPNGSCIDDSRDIQFSVTGNELFVKEINTNPSNYIFETKRTIVSNNGSALKLKIFNVRQSGPSGQVTDEAIPLANQQEYLYNKVN